MIIHEVKVHIYHKSCVCSCYVSTSKNSFSPLECLEMYNLSAPLLIVFAEETFQNV